MTHPTPALRHARSLVGLALGGAMALSALPAVAQTTDQPAIKVPAPVQATVDKLTGGQAKILKAFQAPAGLIGIAISVGKGHDSIIYASPDGKYLVQGVIVSANGDNMTRLAADQYLPKPATAAQNFAVLSQTHTYLWGKDSAKKEIWVVFDPNCIFCHKLFEGLKSHVAAGDVKVHVIQVGFLKPSSLGKAAAIFSAKDPAAALAQDEAKFDTSKEEGSITPDMSNAAAVAKVKANNAWMKAQGIKGTPYMLYRDAGGKPQAIEGYMANTAALLAKIGG